MSKRKAAASDRPGKAPRLSEEGPLLLAWNASGNESNLERIAQATRWEALFQFDAERGPQDPEGREAAVRHKRRLLLLAAHPDKGPESEKTMREAATRNINCLFTEAAKTWSPATTGGTASDAGGPSGALLGDEAPTALLGGPPAAAAAALVGKRVRIHGLSNAAHLNGQYGEVGSVADAERVVVQLDGGEQKSIKPSQLKLVPRSFVRGGVLELLDNLAAATDDDGRPKTTELIYSAELGVYTGFAKAAMLKELKGGAMFEAMAANRSVSAEVIATRTAENCRRRMAGGAYHDFGLISLVAVRYDADGGRGAQYRDLVDPATGQPLRHPTFYVLDGQHRLSTMNALMDPESWVGVDEAARARFVADAEKIAFQISVKVVDRGADANRALMQMQDCYMPDKRCFFVQENEANVAGGALDLAKLAWPRAFVPLDVRGKTNKLIPDRPLLDDGCFFDFLRDTGLLRLATANAIPLADKARYLFDHLRLVNDAIRDGGAPGKLSDEEFRKLGDASGKTSGCFLGYYRRDANGMELMAKLKKATDARSSLPPPYSGASNPVVPPEAACSLP